MKAPVIAAVLAGFAAGAASAADNGTELLAQCTQAVREIEGEQGLTDEDRLAARYCLGFVTGVTSVVSIGYYVKPSGAMFCPPDGGIQPDTAVRQVVEYLRRHPQRLHARKVTLATAAFMQAYPCPRPGAPPVSEPAAPIAAPQ